MSRRRMTGNGGKRNRCRIRRPEYRIRRAWRRWLSLTSKGRAPDGKSREWARRADSLVRQHYPEEQFETVIRRIIKEVRYT